MVVHTAGHDEFVFVTEGEVVAAFVFGIATEAGTTTGAPEGIDTLLAPPVKPGPEEKVKAAWVDARSPAATMEVLKYIVTVNENIRSDEKREGQLVKNECDILNECGGN